MEKVLLVEDDTSLREVLSIVLERDGFAVSAHESAEGAMAELSRQPFQVVLSDFKLPGMNGIELLSKVRETSATVPFIIMTAYGTVEIATEAMKAGANDFLLKPFEPETLSALLRQVLKHRRIVDRSLGLRTRRERTLLGEHPSIHELLGQARKVSRVDTSVLILGESGTGKELLARFIHEQSPRAQNQFIAVNCAAMPPELLESEFFGHEAGAFTGATQTRKGVFEIASEGTIFLDEIGDMPPLLQVKLLRALQEREIRRVGGSTTIKVNPRIIAATNNDIVGALETGQMRDDFYYRVAVVTLTIPPLRERGSDVDLLVDYFTQYFCEAMGKATLSIDSAARALLRSHTWPGNARELENVIERAVILAEKSISTEQLGISLHATIESNLDAGMTLTQIADLAAKKAEMEIMAKVLTKTQGNKVKAAKILGVSYKTLLNKIKAYEMGPVVHDDLIEAPDETEAR